MGCTYPSNTIASRLNMMITPPWQTQESWQAANEAMACAIRGRETDLQRPIHLAAEMLKRIVMLDGIMDSLCAFTCSRCRDACCRHASLWYDFKDLLFIHLSKSALPPGQARGAADRMCRYVTPTGCILPRGQRPFICTWYLCATQKANLQRMAASKVQFLFHSLAALKTGRGQMEDQFIRIISKGNKYGKE